MGTNVILELGPARTEKGVSTQHLWVAGFKGRRVPALVLMPEDANGQRPVSCEQLPVRRIALA